MKRRKLKRRYYDLRNAYHRWRRAYVNNFGPINFPAYLSPLAHFSCVTWAACKVLRIGPSDVAWACLTIVSVAVQSIYHQLHIGHCIGLFMLLLMLFGYATGRFEDP